jgi:cyclase
MRVPRIIPALLVDDGALVKTVRFADPRYVGDPINAVRIFNDKQVDELVVLDIAAARSARAPDEAMIADLGGEAFMPIAYGGGVRDVSTARRLIQIGVEKVIVNTAAIEDPDAVRAIADTLGASTLVVALDVRRTPAGRPEVWVRGGSKPTGVDAVRQAEAAAAMGAGEILLSSIDRDGTMSGYDADLVRQVVGVVDVPVVACGGAAGPDDLVSVIRQAGASAAAAGSMFVFHGRHRAVLITYPSFETRSAWFADAGGMSPTT